jgi:hypothetical protein
MPTHWTILLRAALRQQDPAKLPKLVEQARRAINARVLERGTKSADAHEKEELEEALRQLTLLEQKRKSEPRAKSARPAKMFWHQFQHSTVRRANLLRLGPGNQVLQSIHRPCQESAQKDVMHCVFSAKLRSSWRDGVVQKRWPCAIRPRQWIGRD